MQVKTPNVLIRSLCIGSLAAAALGVMAVPAAAEDVDPVSQEIWSQVARSSMGLRDCAIVSLDAAAAVGRASIALDVQIDGQPHTLNLERHANRSELYEVMVQKPDGTYERAQPGAVQTYRGTLVNEPDAKVAASILEDGLHAMIRRPDDTRWWVEPLSPRVDGAPARLHVVYRSSDVIDSEGGCGNPDQPVGDQKLRMPFEVDVPAVPANQLGGLCIAELACDADTEYFNDYGSVAAVEARINSVINTVNLQYESQVSITHLITTIVVRTGSDPYTSSDAETRLCQFITEWTNNQQGVQRDVAHLFTGVNLNGGTIGIASDIGDTGICVNQGSCTGGTFGTQGSYCLSQSDFDNNFGCVTDLTAHELGHLWGAFHCFCFSNTMNSSITCANNFSAGTINSIINYRNTRTCLDGTCAGGPQPPDNDDCVDATAVSCNFSGTVSNTNATPAAGNDPQLPNGSPSCQWNGNPDATHNTIWYEFVAEDTSILVETCDTTAVQDTIIALYSGSCGNLTELACGEDECGSSTYESSICVNNLIPGNTYLLMVGNPGDWTGSTPGAIELDLTCPCPAVGPVAGSCCLAGGTCVDNVTSSQCSGLGGVFQGAGSDCVPNPCPQDPMGACCFDSGACFIALEVNCTGQGGTYLGDGSVCVDSDGDGVEDGCDGCPNDPNKTTPGVCGCGVPDTDTDGDGVPNCNDGCPNDPNKVSPGICGCGVPDVDSDNDGVLDCNDGCPNDPNKTSPGICGCGTPDTDSDGDGTPDCNDQCPNDPNKVNPGVCGCGVPDTDSDNDGVPDCNDGCPNDPNKTSPGQCGCGTPDADSDGDGTPDCNDQCPNDPNKVNPGACGCGVPDTDSDNDGVPDCDDGCPNDPNKVAPGVCGCGVPDTDSDNDGTPDCNDPCPNDPDDQCVPEACCFSDGSCIDIDPPSCGAQGGVAQGHGIICVQVQCPITTGACCLSNGDCVEASAADCADGQGAYQGDGTLCDDVECPQPCPWDCSPPGGNGTVNFDDLVEVINAISTQDLDCDVAPDNGDGTFGNGVINFDDIIAIINNFGDCP